MNIYKMVLTPYNSCSFRLKETKIFKSGKAVSKFLFSNNLYTKWINTEEMENIKNGIFEQEESFSISIDGDELNAHLTVHTGAYLVIFSSNWKSVTYCINKRALSKEITNNLPELLADYYDMAWEKKYKEIKEKIKDFLNNNEEDFFEIERPILRIKKI